MVQRKTLPAEDNREITVVTEQMKDGRWAVVTSVKHFTGTAEQITDLPMPEERFATDAEAEEFGVRMAREWIARNTPQAA